MLDLGKQKTGLALQLPVLDAFHQPGQVGQVLTSMGEKEAPAWRTLLPPGSFHLPAATRYSLGGVIVGRNLSVDASGRLSAADPLPGPIGPSGPPGVPGPMPPAPVFAVEAVTLLNAGAAPQVDCRVDPQDGGRFLLRFALPEGRPGTPGRNPALLPSKDPGNALRLGSDGLLHVDSLVDEVRALRARVAELERRLTSSLP